MGQLNLRQHHHRNARWSVTIAGAALAVFVSPALAFPAFAQPGSGHASATGHITATRPMAPSPSMMPNRSMVPSRSMGGPMGTPIHSGQRGGTVRSNSFGASSAPPPSWELPRYVTPHWEIGPNVQVQPNPVQGNHVPRDRGNFGVGYVGFPYYVDPMAFVDANTVDDTAQQAQPNAPAGPDYGPQAPYAGGPYDQGYAPAPRAPYNPDGYPPPQNSAATQSTAAQNAANQSAAAQDDGLDHPPVTLVFNDGRPPLQVNNYVLTGSSVFVAEHGRQRVIPVADLDLPATIAQNREAGVDFALPGGTK
jgi:hypothetical protein